MNKERERRIFAYVFICVFILSFFSLALVYAQEDKGGIVKSQETGTEIVVDNSNTQASEDIEINSIGDVFKVVWGEVKENTKSAYNSTVNFVDDKFKKVVGVRNLEGENITWFGSFSLKYFLIFLGIFILIYLYLFVLLYAAVAEKKHKGGFIKTYKSIFTYLLGIIIYMVLYFLYLVFNSKLVKNDNFLYNELPFLFFIFLFGFIFNLIYLISMFGNSKGILVGIVSGFIKYNKRIWIIPLIYLVLIGFPVINQFLKVITLEVLGVHWIWRSFIWAAILFFIPKMIEEYKKHVADRKEYEDKLEELSDKETKRMYAKG